MKKLIYCFCLVGSLCFASLSTGKPANTGYVVLISIDALSPTVYLNPKRYQTLIPNIISLMEKGSYAKKLIPVTPILSYPNHTSVVTGTVPSKHGITSNYLKDSESLILNAKRIQSTTIWDAATTAGLKTAAVNWPITYAAKINYLIPQNLNADIPEVDTDFAVSAGNLEKLIASGVKPAGMLDTLNKNISNPKILLPLNNSLERANNLNYMSGAFAAQIIKLYQPNLLLVHFADPNSPLNVKNANTRETLKVLSKVDQYIGTMMKAVESSGMKGKTTYVLISAEHATQTIQLMINPQLLVLEANKDLATPNAPDSDSLPTLPNTRFPSALMVKITDSGRGVILMPSNAGNLALAKAQLARVKSLIEGKYSQYITFSTDIPENIRALSPVSVLGYLAAKPGYLFTLRESNDGSVFIKPTPEMRPMVYTGFIMSGYHVVKDLALPQVSTIDIAPTIAELLGVALPSATGKVMRELLIAQPNASVQ